MLVDFEDIDLNSLVAFDLVMRNASVTETAARLGRPVSKISRDLTEFSTQLGGPLFTRNGREMVPTERAKEIEEPVRTAIGDLRRCLTSQPRFDVASSRRTFRVDIPVGGDLVLAPLLTAYASQHAPGVSIIVLSSRAGDVWPELQAGEVDLAIDYKEVGTQDVRRELLYDDPFVVLARRGHPGIARHGGLTRELFMSARHVAVSWTRAPRESPVDQRLREHNIERRSDFFVPSIAAIPGIVEQSDCFAMLSRRVARNFAARWAIEFHDCPVPLSPVPIYIVWHARFDNDPGHQWLRRAMTFACQQI